MIDELSIEELDRDGALRETAAQAAEVGDTRNQLLRRGAIAGGGLLIGAVPLAAAVAQGSLPKGDIAILNFALTLEYLEAAFYKEAVASGKIGGRAGKFASVVSQHEAAHVAALQKTLGSNAVKEPKFDFKGTTGDEKKFIATAIVLEDTGVSAYQGAAPSIKTPAVLAAAGSILPIEARHASWIRNIQGAGQSPVPAPDAFSAPKSMSQVLAAVKSTGFIKS